MQWTLYDKGTIFSFTLKDFFVETEWIDGTPGWLSQRLQAVSVVIDDTHDTIISQC